MHYNAISNNSTHAYSPYFSPKYTSQKSVPRHSFVGIMSFWQTIDIILESVLWMYYVNFPMLFHPRDVIIKFGFSPPMGLFVDSKQTAIIKNTLRPEDYDHFYTYSKNHEHVNSLTSWYDDLKTLSSEEIIASWPKDDGEVPSERDTAKMVMIGKMRAIRETMALLEVDTTKFDNPIYDKIDLSYNKWKDDFKKYKKH